MSVVLAAAGVMSACVVQEPDVVSRADELVIPGPWNPPASTRAIAATQYVPVVDPPPVSPAGSCSSSNPFACSCTHPACREAFPGTAELDRYLRDHYAGTRYGGLFCCRQNSAATRVPMLSVHAIGRAIDLMVAEEGGDANNGVGDAVANWLVENAEFIGVQRVIWDRAFWNGERGFGLLSSASSPHTNHLHIELSIDGAARRTDFFTSGASTGVCTARCEGMRIINADCSSGDCGAYGVPCLPGPPPMCGPPPPPEPDEAAAVAGATLPTFAPVGTPARFTFVPPRRLFDTRTASLSTELTRGDGTTAGPLGAMSTSVYRSASTPVGASALWLNLATISLGAPGFVTVYPVGATRPATSNVNVEPGFVRANAVPAVLGDTGGVSLFALADAEGIMDLSGVFTPTGAGLTSQGPVRVFDSRSTDEPLLADTTREIDVAAPAGATGVVATVTVVAGAEAGFVQAFPCGTTPPETSNINYGAGAAVANTILSELGGGLLCVRSITDVHLIVDVTGYLSPDGPLSYQALTPQRLLDTRGDTTPFSGRLGRGQVIELPVQSLAGMPGAVWAVVANLTALGANDGGFVTAFPCGGAAPATSSLNFQPGGVIGSLTVAALGPDGSLCLFAHSRTHLIVDVVGVWVHDESLIPPPPQPIPPEGEPDPLPPGDDAGVPTADGGLVDGGGGGGISSGCGCATVSVRSGHRPPLAFLFAALVALRVRRKKR